MELMSGIRKGDTVINEATEIELERISSALVGARVSKRALSEFPEQIPDTLSDAYSVQTRSILRWKEKLIGWKVGGIPQTARAKFGDSWLVGPIFENKFWKPCKQPLSVPFFNGGSAFVEAEFVLELGSTRLLSTRIPGPEDIIPYVRACYAGVEIASSPVANINDLGPGAIISDFGNNNGLIVGRKVTRIALENLSEIEVSTTIDGRCVGSARSRSLPGGPLAAAAFLVANLFERGIDVPEGLLVSSGAITGVHPILVGETACIEFEGIDKIELKAIGE